MLSHKIALAITCGIASTTSTLAQEQSATFEYWPVARQLRSGQFQAEVWRHDLRNDYSDLAWSNQEPFATPATAMAKACTSVQIDFDASFSCSRVAHLVSASDRETATQGSAVIGKKMAVTAVESKRIVVKGPMQPLSIAKARVNSGERHAWLKDFWKIGGK
jgi:hypothetical protein